MEVHVEPKWSASSWPHLKWCSYNVYVYMMRILRCNYDRDSYEWNTALYLLLIVFLTLTLKPFINGCAAHNIAPITLALTLSLLCCFFFERDNENLISDIQFQFEIFSGVRPTATGYCFWKAHSVFFFTLKSIDTYIVRHKSSYVFDKIGTFRDPTTSLRIFS